jgi:hypothetical protein
MVGSTIIAGTQPSNLKKPPPCKLYHRVFKQTTAFKIIHGASKTTLLRPRTLFAASPPERRECPRLNNSLPLGIADREAEPPTLTEFLFRRTQIKIRELFCESQAAQLTNIPNRRCNLHRKQTSTVLSEPLLYYRNAAKCSL